MHTKLGQLLCLLLAIALTLTPHANAFDFEIIQIRNHHFIICRVNPSQDHLQLFLNDDTGQKLKSFSALKSFIESKGQTVAFAMNAGMYQPGYNPVGLFIANGHQLSPLNLAQGAGNFFMQPNGVFFLTPSGAHILASQDYSHIHEHVVLATQSGPMLVRDGHINSNFNPSSQSLLPRNGVGITSSGEIIFAIADDPVNFYEFATAFRDTLHCPNALFLDGTISSLYAPPLHRNDHPADIGPIIAIVK